MDKPLNEKNGAKLAAIFRSHRERSGLTVLDVFEATRIPKDVLEAFEQNALHDHPTFNRVYLRSVVRSYASAVGFPESEALAALEAAEQATAEATLNASPEASPEASPKATPEATAKAAAQVGADARATADADDATHVARKSGPVRDEQDSPLTSGSGAAVVVTRSAMRIVAIAALCLVIVGVAIIYFVTRPSVDAPTQSTAATAAGESENVGSAGGMTRETSGMTDDDSLSAENATPSINGSPAQPQASELTEADSVAVLIRSLGQPVRGIRIRLDRGLRRPYWIERDSTLTLYFRERAIIEEHNGLVRVDAPALAFSVDRPAPGRAVTVRR